MSVEKDEEKRLKKNQEAEARPKPGDYWHEMFCPYFIVLHVDPLIICDVVHDNEDGTWSWALEKSKEVEAFPSRVHYNTEALKEKYVADCLREAGIVDVEHWQSIDQPFTALPEENDMTDELLTTAEHTEAHADVIKGYRKLDEDEIALINEIKRHGEQLRDLIAQVDSHDKVDPLWLAMARTDLQVGIMKLVRAVACPESF